MTFDMFYNAFGYIWSKPRDVPFAIFARTLHRNEAQCKTIQWGNVYDELRMPSLMNGCRQTPGVQVAKRSQTKFLMSHDPRHPLGHPKIFSSKKFMNENKSKKEDPMDSPFDENYILVADMETKEYILSLLCERCQLRCSYRLTECNTCSVWTYRFRT
jgi:hypothetical protein